MARGRDNVHIDMQRQVSTTYTREERHDASSNEDWKEVEERMLGDDSAIFKA